MKNVFYYSDNLHLDILPIGAEVIIEHRDLSRFGRLDSTQFNHAVGLLKQKSFRIALEWDILMTDSDFPKVITSLNELHLDNIDLIRVQDPGAIEYVKENLTHPVVLILETGNHNLFGIQTWIDYLDGRVNRVSLSVELDKSTLKKYTSELSVPVEFLALGRILIFYTPRNLLSSLLPEDDEVRKKSLLSSEFLEASGESEESPHKGFPLIENKHGTYMFHIKRLYLLDCLDDLKDCGIEFLRIDTRFDGLSHLKDIIEAISTNTGKEYRAEYPFDVIKGYFNINKTDVLFKKLKNYRLQRKDDSYIGEVLETNKAQYMAIMVKKKSLHINDELKFITPEGKELICKVHELTNSIGVSCDEIKKDELALMNYFGSVWPKSQVYKN